MKPPFLNNKNLPISELDNEETLDYKKKITGLKKRHKFISSLLGFLYSLIVLAIIITLGYSFMMNREKAHTPITSDLLTIEQHEEEDTYAVSITEAETINGTQYVNINIGNYKKTITKEQSSSILGNTKITTKIYVAEVTLNDPYFLSFINNRSFVFVRFSCLGEGAFGESELAQLKELAADYFTFEKYRLFYYKDRIEEPDYNRDFAGGKRIVAAILQNN